MIPAMRSSLVSIRPPAPGAEAHELAATLVTMLEGAHVLARATGGIECFDQAARALTTLVEGRYES